MREVKYVFVFLHLTFGLFTSMHLCIFQFRFDEARACIKDCEEARVDLLNFAEEFEAAQAAVDQVFSCYTDLLDDFRRASDDQLEVLCQERLALAQRLRNLRQELHSLTETK